MGFLDNSGDIILDAVLTDTGRKRLAKGDGSFRIVKFALGDDEINYELYDKNHASGSAYYDLEVLQTPVLESFTNNTSMMKSKLISIPRDNLLFLPVLKLNEVFDNATKRHADSKAFNVAVNSTSETEFATIGSTSLDGVLFGEDPAGGGNYIRVDQGLDTSQISPARVLDPLLVETQFIIEIDSRFGSITSLSGKRADVSFIDDDLVASYFLSLGTDAEFVMENTDTSTTSNQTIAGPRGTVLKLKIQSSLELNTSDYLFDTLGSTGNMLGKTGNPAIKLIDSTVRVTGANTGYRIDIPVRFVKKQ
jgi:hypothetical protein